MSKILVEDHIFSNYDFPSQTLHKKFPFFPDFAALCQHQPQILTPGWSCCRSRWSAGSAASRAAWRRRWTWSQDLRLGRSTGPKCLYLRKKKGFFVKGLWRKIVIRKNVVFDQKKWNFVFAPTFFIFKKSCWFFLWIEVVFPCGANGAT